MAKGPLLAALLALGALAGCMDDSTPLGAPAVHGVAAGSPAGHGETSVSEGSVSVRPSGDGRFTASRTVTVSNGFGGASRGVIDLKTVNGGLAVGPGGPEAYRAVVQISASANSEAQAREALATLRVEDSDELSDGVLRIGVEVVFGRYEARDVSRTGSVTLTVPPGPAYSAEAATVNGGIRFADLRGDAFEADSVNGGIEVDGVRGRSLSASTSSGGVDVQGEFDDVDASTTNGGIDAEIAPQGSGTFRFDTVNGGIDVALERGRDRGYDVTAETVNGGIDLDLAGSEDAGSQQRNHRHVRTAGYGEADIRTLVFAETVNGGIDVSDG